MKKIFVIFTVICNVLLTDSRLLEENGGDNILDLINYSGYFGESHQVETEDGYLLKIHRVSSKRAAPDTSKKPVFLMHGILATAADFLLTGPDIALAYLLADEGHDVFLGNARGSRHSMKHRTFSPDSSEFWNFSWHEIGYYDLPTMFDYMLNCTQSSKGFYVGHSQGTTAFLVFLATRPEYSEKVVLAHLMAPSAFRKKLPRLRTIIYGLEFLVKFN